MWFISDYVVQLVQVVHNKNPLSLFFLAFTLTLITMTARGEYVSWKLVIGSLHISNYTLKFNLKYI